MLFTDNYYTIREPSAGTYKDRGSKFFAFAFPVKTAAEIKLQIEALKQVHPSAVHHCYAWRLGADKTAYKLSDDGEPSGTAGKQIYAQIQSRDLTNILVVVIRYFGGSLLGVPGLILAYKTAANEALVNAQIIELYVMEEFRIEFDAEDTSKVMVLLKSIEADFLKQEYKTRNELTFRIRKTKAIELEKKLKSYYKTKLHFIQTLQ